MASDDQKVACDGTFAAVVKQASLQGISEKLQGSSVCKDGRKLTFVVSMTDLGISKGFASDDCGNRFDFYFGASPSRTQEMIGGLKPESSLSDGSGDRCSSAHPAIPPHRDPV